MQFMGRMLDGVHYAMGVNAATLSGAVDIVVVASPDGDTLRCTPFHVRFGKMQIIRALGTEVTVSINDEVCGLRMRLGSAGEAYFVEDDDEGAAVAAPMPAAALPGPDKPSRTESMFVFPTGASGVVVAGAPAEVRNATQAGSAASASVSPPDVVIPMRSMSAGMLEAKGASIAAEGDTGLTWSWGELPQDHGAAAAAAANGTNGGRNSSRKVSLDDSAVVGGELRRSPLAASAPVVVAASGVAVTVPQPPAAQQPQQPPEDALSRQQQQSSKWKSLGSAVGRMLTGAAATPSPPPPQPSLSSGAAAVPTPPPVLPVPGEIEVSLCAAQLEEASNRDNNHEASKHIFNKNRVDYEHFSKDPTILFNPELVVKIDDKIYPWAVAGPMILSCLLYGKPLDPEGLAQLDVTNRILSPKAGRLPAMAAAAPSAATEPAAPAVAPAAAVAQKEDSTWVRYKSWLWSSRTTTKELDDLSEDSNAFYDAPEDIEEDNKPVQRKSSTDLTNALPVVGRSLCPSSDELKRLNLKDGPNRVTFSVRTGLRGIQTVSCMLYLWKSDVPIVISDIDGTITRSDIPGMFLPYVGRDWSQIGVTSLFAKVKENGYNIVYLTARSIGQANSTRGFISGLTQGSTTLPPGPVFMNPDRLLSAFTREVIERKPEEFKIRCLDSLRSLYPHDFIPFIAGFGNRHSDAYSYTAVGISRSRIFIINPQGTMTTDNLTYKKTYTDLSALVAEMFPPKKDHTVPDDFSDANYWRDTSLEWPLE